MNYNEFGPMAQFLRQELFFKVMKKKYTHTHTEKTRIVILSETTDLFLRSIQKCASLSKVPIIFSTQR